MRVFRLCAWLPLALLLVRPAAAGDIFDLARSGDAAATEALIDKSGPEIANSVTADGVTPLHIAAALNHTDVAATLLNNTAKVNARTKGGFTPLHWAAGRDALDAAKLLIARGADVNAATLNGITPLHWAAANNATNTLMLLLAKGADVQAATDEGLLPLHWAVMKGADEAALLLAFKTVSDEMAEEVSNKVFHAAATNVASTAVAPPAAPPTGRTSAPPASIRSPPLRVSAPPEPEAESGTATKPKDKADTVRRPALGSSFIVPLGRGQSMEFLWLEGPGFWAGKCEVTNGQFRRFRPRHTSGSRDGLSLDGDTQPAVFVSWNDARDFCKWLNGNLRYALPKGFEFALPTSTQWMAMASCGDTRKYPWGNAWPPAYGNYSDASASKQIKDWKGIAEYNDGFPVTCPVADSGVNEWGIFGLAGNVWEWCEDWYDASHEYKVRHGGGWDFDGEIGMRIETRGFDRPDAAYDTIGFRVVVVPKASQR